MRADVFNKLADPPRPLFRQPQTGEIISRISYDIDTVNASLSTDLLQIFTSLTRSSLPCHDDRHIPRLVLVSPSRSPPPYLLTNI
jgi:ATP-binding cassette subfamily B protein